MSKRTIASDIRRLQYSENGCTAVSIKENQLNDSDERFHEAKRWFQHQAYKKDFNNLED